MPKPPPPPNSKTRPPLEPPPRSKAPASRRATVMRPPSFQDVEADTGSTSALMSRWRMIARDIADMDEEGRELLAAVARALTEPQSLDGISVLQDYDEMDERRRAVLSAVSHALVLTSGRTRA